MYQLQANLKTVKYNFLPNNFHMLQSAHTKVFLNCKCSINFCFLSSVVLLCNLIIWILLVDEISVEFRSAGLMKPAESDLHHFQKWVINFEFFFVHGARKIF